MKETDVTDEQTELENKNLNEDGCLLGCSAM
jgi:hypothetical protein